MNDLVKCARCNKTLIAESFREHDCSTPFRDVKTIIIDFHTTTKDSLGRETILAQGTDGIMYRLVTNDKEAIPIPFNPSDASYHPDDSNRSDDKLPEPQNEDGLNICRLIR